ncbi:PREDICTED: 14.7 kDa heat shock protein-like [Nicotiana attenuata]|uniref:14.7 kDa heat shock protein n=1 Tax=Nicotiana attenuata TaxID=49451 RepID=A0A1J6KVC7_NICAT|nr:PREDICTED: 14.7 kDa heat shock protein-like [Nicotiana attenuata]OIT23025.1 14.7 kda heat shock protein [Nicotiana attenuata]
MALSLRKAAGASTLFKYLSPKSHFTTAPPSITRLFSSTTTSDSDSTSKEQSNSPEPIMVKGAPQDIKMENPFQSAGPSNVLEVDNVKDGILVRVAMPGVSEDRIKVWLENNTVYFTGKGEIELESEKSGRKYGGSLEFKTDCCKAEKVEAQIKDGILRMVVKGEMGEEG